MIAHINIMCSSLAFNWVIISGHRNKPSPPQYKVLSNDHKTPQHPLRSWITYAHALSSKCTHGVWQVFQHHFSHLLLGTTSHFVTVWGQLPTIFSGQPTIFHSLPQPSTHLVRVKPQNERRTLCVQ